MSRTYRIKYHRDLRHDSPFHWRLYTYGQGRWCVGQGHAGSFATESEAVRAGDEWVRSGPAIVGVVWW